MAVAAAIVVVIVVAVVVAVVVAEAVAVVEAICSTEVLAAAPDSRTDSAVYWAGLGV